MFIEMISVSKKRLLTGGSPSRMIYVILTCSIVAIVLWSCSPNSLLSSLQQSNGGASPTSLPAPTFNLPGGTYFMGQQITLSDSETGATIYFTTDGSTPTTSSTIYKGSTITTGSANTTTTIKAIAAESGMRTSSVSSATYSIVQTAKWAHSESFNPTASPSVGVAWFNGGIADTAGNSYAYGSAYGQGGSFSFGNIKLPTENGSGQPLLVKYNSSGTAQWVATYTSGAYGGFNGAAFDSSGNVYVVGDLGGTGTSTFGTGVSFTGLSSGATPVVVEYTSGGTATSGAAATAETVPATFQSVAVDSSGNIYIAGFMNSGSNGSVSFGNNVTVSDPRSQSGDWFLVKYNSSFTAQWAVTFTSGSPFGEAGQIAVDSSGNVYVPLMITSGAGTYGFGNGVSVTGGAFKQNAVLVKYNTSGTALWAEERDNGNYSSVALDSSGNIYVGGGGNYAVSELNGLGTVLWSDAAPGASFSSIALGTNGYLYTAGTNNGTALINFGNNIYCASEGASGTASFLIAKYSLSGMAQWVQSAAVAPANSLYYSVAADSSGYVFAFGWINGSSTFGLGNNTNVTAGSTTGGQNVLIAEYQ